MGYFIHVRSKIDNEIGVLYPLDLYILYYFCYYIMSLQLTRSVSVSPPAMKHGILFPGALYKNITRINYMILSLFINSEQSIQTTRRDAISERKACMHIHIIILATGLLQGDGKAPPWLTGCTWRFQNNVHTENNNWRGWFIDALAAVSVWLINWKLDQQSRLVLLVSDWFLVLVTKINILIHCICKL